MLINLQIQEFIDELGSASPAPGGGSVAALNGALGAGLVAMVTRLTIGKKGYEALGELLEDTRDKADELKTALTGLIDKDTQAFNGVMAAFKMSRATNEEKSARSAAIQKGYKEATRVPMETAERCLAVLELACEIAGKTNPNTASDLGVAAQVACAGVEGAVMNVKINLPAIKDADWTAGEKAKTRELLSTAARYRDRVAMETARLI